MIRAYFHRCLYQQNIIHSSRREIAWWVLQGLAPRWVLQVDVFNVFNSCFVVFWICITADVVTAGTSGSSLMAKSSCWQPPRTLWPLFLAYALTTLGTPSWNLNIAARVRQVSLFVLSRIQSLTGLISYLGVVGMSLHKAATGQETPAAN